jgi:DHA1 family inner membrane transport protein
LTPIYLAHTDNADWREASALDLRLVWLALGSFAVAIDGFVIGSLLPAIADETGVTIAQAGYIVFAFSVTTAIGSPVLATLFGASDRRRVLTSGSLIFALGALLIALAPSFPLILGARIVIAMGAGLYVVMSQAAAVAMSPPERRGRAVGTVLLGTTLAVALGVPLAAFIASVSSWRTAYLLIAVLGLLSAVMLWMVIPAGLTGARRTLRERIGVVALPGVPRLLAISAFFMLGSFMPLIYVAPITTDGLGLDRSIIPLVLFANGIGSVAGSHFGGRLADRFGGIRTTFFAAILHAISLALFSIIAILPAAVILPVYVAVTFIYAGVAWGFHTAQISRIAALAGEQAPLAISLNGTAVNIGAALAALLGGVVLERFGAGAIGWIAALAPLVSIGLLATQRRVAVPSPRTSP